METPNIDFLAENGILFNRFYGATPICSPSCGSLISVIYPQHTGVPVNDVPMKDNVIPYSQIVACSGYITKVIGK